MPRDHNPAQNERLPGAIVGREWRTEANSMPPQEWVHALWSLDAAVQAAIKGGWTDEEIATEARQLTESYRARAEDGDDG